MAKETEISWTDSTANFWWGCMKVSPGCKNCYAETLSKRYGKAIWGTPETTDRELKVGIWKELPKWNEQAKRKGKRRRVFVQSMADFFEDHPQASKWRKDAMQLIEKCEWLDFQILTKRPENVRAMAFQWLAFGFPDNVWIGTSVENQEMADKRIPELLKIPAKVRFLSMEPLLEKVDLSEPLSVDSELAEWIGENVSSLLFPSDLLNWVIVGGESGHSKRPFNPDWARSIRDQCQDAGISFFMKQIDKVQPIPADLMIREFPHV